MDELLHTLSEAKVGCYIGDVFVGALAYADDLVLTAPSANALRKMLAICDAYASEYFMNFNAQKIKCIIVILVPGACLLHCLANVLLKLVACEWKLCHLQTLLSS